MDRRAICADLEQRPSKHVYIRKLPDEIGQQIDRLRDSEVIRNDIMRNFRPTASSFR